MSFYHLFTKHLFCFPLWKKQFSTLFIVDKVDNFVHKSILKHFQRFLLWITRG